MRLIKGNVERVVSTEGAAAKLLSDGFRLLQTETVEEVEQSKDLADFKVDELKALAKEKGIAGCESLTKKELLEVLKE